MDRDPAALETYPTGQGSRSGCAGELSHWARIAIWLRWRAIPQGRDRDPAARESYPTGQVSRSGCAGELSHWAGIAIWLRGRAIPLGKDRDPAALDRDRTGREGSGSERIRAALQAGASRAHASVESCTALQAHIWLDKTAACPDCCCPLDCHSSLNPPLLL